MTEKLSAFVMGGTGGAGWGIVTALAREPRFYKVLLMSRREIELPKSDKIFNYNKFEQKLIPNFEVFLKEDISRFFTGYDVGFYAVGVRSSGLDELTFRKIVQGYPTAVARQALKAGCKQFNWLSAVGVKPRSRFLYGRVKFEVETELAQLGFQRVSIYRPAAILTDANSGGMMGKLGVKILRFVDNSNRLSVEADMLGAVAVANVFLHSYSSNQIFTNAEIIRLGRKLYISSNKTQT